MNDSLTFELFCRQYDNEEACIQTLFSARWPHGFCCPRCAHRHSYVIRSRKLPLYECSSCHVQTSLIAGTILEGSRTSLKLWFQALFLHTQPQGISASQLTSIIGTTYKTAWLICHKIRHAMSCADSRELLTGLVRVNWGVYGRPYNPTIYLHPQEQPLLAGASIDPDGQLTHLKIKQVPDDQLLNSRISTWGGRIFISQNVDPNASEVFVVTQMFSRHRYFPLIQVCFEGSRWINNTFRGIGPKHLQAYLDQYCFGINMSQRDINIFTALLYQCVLTRTINYPTLIRRKNNSAQRKHNYAEHLKKVS